MEGIPRPSENWLQEGPLGRERILELTFIPLADPFRASNYYCALSEFCCHFYIYVQWAVNFWMGMANSSTTTREHTQQVYAAALGQIPNTLLLQLCTKQYTRLLSTFFI